MTMSQFTTKHLPEAYDYLAPDCSEIRLLPTFPSGGLAHCVLPPHRTAKAVIHQTVVEIWYCLAGSGQIWRKQHDREEVTDLSAGTSITIPLETAFQFRNTGSEPLCILLVSMPEWPGAHEARPSPDYWPSDADCTQG